jgi:hypothetical protein
LPLRHHFDLVVLAAMADFDDYESLPDNTPFHVTATAGALAGIAEHVALYPVDSVKVHILLLSFVRNLRMIVTDNFLL